MQTIHNPDRNLMVMMPPRHGKSETTSYYTPAWVIENNHHARVILASYEADFAASWGRKVRNLLENNKHELSVRIAGDSSAAERWHTTEGGGMFTAGVGGPITGKGGDVLILDDPIKNAEQAYSATYRDKVWDWWGSTFLTRREPGASVIMVLTRWHDDDIAGRVLKENGDDWDVLRFPAIAEGADELGRQAGDALWPGRYNAERLASMRRQVGNYVWGALYQQTPPNLEGGAVYYAFDPTFGSGNLRPDLELTDLLPLQLSADFNINPGCHALIGQHHTATDTATAVHEIHAANMHAESMAETFVRWVESTGGFRWPHLEIFGDASGESRFSSDGKSAWDKVRAVLERQGWPIKFRIESRNPPVADRVDYVNNALRNPVGDRRYLIHPRCERLIADLRQMKWDGNELNKKDRKLSHASDADGYRIYRILPLRRLFGHSSNRDVTAI